MTLLTAAMLDSLRSTGLPDQWPGVVAHDDSLRTQLEFVISSQSDDVRNALIERIAAGDQHGPAWARAAIWGLGLASLEGARARAVIAPGLLHMTTSTGSPFVLAPLAFAAGRGAGERKDINRLIETLDGALTGRHYTLHLKKPLPKDVNTQPIAAAVHLWLMALRDGSEVGRCASYEDSTISIEICLTDLEDKDKRGGLVVLVKPKRSLEKLAQVDSRLMHVANEARQVAPNLPVVALLAADGPWKLPRGYVNQVLYGTPREVFATSDPGKSRYEALYRANGLSLFSDPHCTALQAVWWAEPSSDGGLGVVAWSHENPWAETSGHAPVLRGRRFWLREGPRGAHGAAVMEQGTDDPVQWGPSA